MATWLAPAKLNLFLHIVGRRTDGYHELQTVFQFIDRYDELTFHVQNNPEISVHDPVTNIPQEKHLVYRAAKLLQATTHCSLGADIFVTKNIPEGAGLGGGSSDAATTLVALNQIWSTQLSREELAGLGLQLGADVPVFVHGHSAWAEGIGEKLTFIEPPELWYLVIQPPCRVDTKKIYSDPELTRDSQKITIHDFQHGQVRNDFEVIVRKRFPEVDRALQWLRQYADAKITGSGCCIFAKFSDNADAERLLQIMPQTFKGFVAKGLNRSPLYAV